MSIRGLIYGSGALVVIVVVVGFLYQRSSICSSLGYYRDLSLISVSLQSSLVQTVSDARVGLEATVNNGTPHLFQDAALAVSVADPSGSIVDRFIVSRVSVGAQGKFPVRFSWHVPLYAASGTYSVRASFVPSVHSSYGSSWASSGSSAAVPITVFSHTPADGRFASDIALGEHIISVQDTNAQTPFVGSLTWRVWAPDSDMLSTPLQEVVPIQLLPGSSQWLSVPFSGDQMRSGSYVEAVLLQGNGVPADIAGGWVDGIPPKEPLTSQVITTICR